MGGILRELFEDILRQILEKLEIILGKSRGVPRGRFWNNVVKHKCTECFVIW